MIAPPCWRCGLPGQTLTYTGRGLCADHARPTPGPCLICRGGAEKPTAEPASVEEPVLVTASPPPPVHVPFCGLCPGPVAYTRCPHQTTDPSKEKP